VSAAFVVAAGCGGPHAATPRPERASPQAPAPLAPPSAVATPSAPPNAGTPPRPKEKQGFYVAAAGRCSEWSVSNGLAQHSRQGPLGAVVLQFKVRASAAELADGHDYQRIGPVERVKDRLEALECYSCVLERDPTLAYPWQRCGPVPPARWYTERADCEREAPLLQKSPDAGSLTGGELRNDVACELSEENERAQDAEDDAAYDAADKQLESALATGQRRLRALQAALSRTRQVFGRREERCEAWNLRQDADSPSGWLSREEIIGSGHHLLEFRFAGTPEGVRLTGWIETALPSRQDPSEGVDLGGLCEVWTSLSDVSDGRAKFTDQVWFFSRTACEKGAGVGPYGFGPECRRYGR
jgi:hypothetical protein